MVTKVALVTGAGSGIGRAAAVALAGDGCSIGALGRTASELEDVVRQIEASGHNAIALETDISSEDQMRFFLAQLQHKVVSLIF